MEACILSYEESVLHDNLETIVIENIKAGELNVRLPYRALLNVEHLTISGDLNGSDIGYLRRALNIKLKYLDLANVNIVAGGHPYYKDYVTEDSVIGNRMFYGTDSLYSIILPKNLKSIGNYAFDGCKKLSSIYLPDGLQLIGKGAFYGCIGTKRIEIPSSVTKIDGLAFSGCLFERNNFINNSSCKKDNFWGAKLYDVETSDGLFIGNNIVLACKPDVKDVVAPEGVEIIEPYAFYNCKTLKTIELPNSLKKIGRNAFAYCKNLHSIYIPNSVSEIGKEAFKDCECLEAIEFPDSLIAIESRLLSGCKKLSSVSIPDGVCKIGTQSFIGCSELSTISFPRSITSIESSCFYYCGNLKVINSWIVNFNTINIGKDAFYGISKECKWHVLAGKNEEYVSQPWWLSTWTIVDDL